MNKVYTISDGKMVLHLHPAPEGGYTVTSPLDTELVTEADSVPEAFEMARDALKTLQAARRRYAREISAVRKSATKISRQTYAPALAST